MASTTETQELCRRYFEAWTHRDTDTVRTCLAEQYEFDAGAMYMTGRDAFLEQAAYPPLAVTRMVGDAYQGSVGFQLYESCNGAASVRIAEQLLVEEGRIAASVVVTDMSSFQQFMAGGT